jgi:hypothetical protein
MNNRYYICPYGSNSPIYLDLSNDLSKLEQKIKPNFNFNYYGFSYFLKVFENIEKSSSIKNFIFYLTWSNLEQLPSYGQDVVAIVIGDEWCRVPKYCYRVRAVFKCYGIRPTLGCNPLSNPSYLNIMTLFNFMRVWTIGLPGRLNYTFHKFRTEQSSTVKIAPIYDIPLGYHNQLDLPIKAIQDRLYDVSFAGSIEQKLYSVLSWNYWLKSPKTIARKQMVSAINFSRDKNPDIKFELTITSHFGASRSASAKTYSEKLMDTKICLVPRGASLETYRFFEAIRYGCIVVTEALPSRWFYNDSPAIKITDWSNLVGILDDLVDNPELMNKKHQESLDWWKTKCSEVAVADYITQKLNSHSK